MEAYDNVIKNTIAMKLYSNINQVVRKITLYLRVPFIALYIPLLE